MKPSISVITWRIGRTPIEDLETLMLNENNRVDTLTQLKKEFGSIFYLPTCQRIILATSENSEETVRQFQNRYTELTSRNIGLSSKGERYIGTKALFHLSKIISSLDSIVLGEDQIQHQFKKAYKDNEEYMDNKLKSIIQNIIRTGKRIRNKTVIKYGKTSTINLIAIAYGKRLTEAKSIGVLGTGKMGIGVIKEISKINENIHVYSRKENRIGTKVDGLVVKDFNDFDHHDVAITATSVFMPLVTKEMIKNFGNEDMLIFDLGIPRNCSKEINELDNIELVGIDDLLQISNELNKNTDMNGVHEVINEEMQTILAKLKQEQFSDQITSLRSELRKIADDRKTLFLNDDPKAEKFYNQLVNQLIHVSQQYLEKALIE